MRRQPIASSRPLTALLPLLGLAVLVSACETGTATSTNGGGGSDEWPYIGGDAAHTRSTGLNQINPQNLTNLEVAWEWMPEDMGQVLARPNPIYVNGKLITVAGEDRHVVSLDPTTGQKVWSYVEPTTFRREYSMRANHGKGVAYANVDGRDVVFLTSPAFFLTALDANTGQPLENWGRPVPLEGFPQTGVVDVLEDLVSDWKPWTSRGEEFDYDNGLPLELGYITSSSPPIVVNDVVVVGNSAEQGYHQTRAEAIPGDILAYDIRTGEKRWQFHMVPRPGEFGHETWENDSWTYGEVSSWAPMAADPERNLVFIPTNSGTVDYFGGHRPGDNLYGTSIIALDTRTGERVWHFQMVHHDVWNYDTSTSPVLVDVNLNGQDIPAVVQVGKQAFAYAFNRVSGEPLWPIEERPVPAGAIPGEKLSPTQPFPTKPAPYDGQGLTVDDLVDFTPELRAEAIANLEDFTYGPLFHPPLHRDNDLGKQGALWCPGNVGGVNIDGPAAADPATGVLYVTSRRACSGRAIVPGAEADGDVMPNPTGSTIVGSAAGTGGGRPRGPQGLPLFKPPYSRITAIDMNTGEHLWVIPVGETPQRYRDNPALEGIDIGNTGTGTVAPMIVTPSMLMYTAEGSDGTPYLFGVDKTTGEQLGKIALPSLPRYGMMTYSHDGVQHVVLQVTGGLFAVRLPPQAE